jgi:hypothetical protein
MWISVFLLATLFIAVKSACDNQCSGHGTCMLDDVCKCYDNWGVGLSHDSGDCSEMVCPYEIAWVDGPSKAGLFHKYAECAGRGTCDRATGECVCFDGYEGKACARTSCPNDCSGHGTCEYIEDLGFASAWNDYTPRDFFQDKKTFPYAGWDLKKQRSCVCDATYGDIDCSKRMCPYGTDVLDTRDNLLVSQKYQTQKLLFISGNALEGDYTTNTGDRVDLLESAFSGKTFALTFKSKLNETFTTIPIVLKTISYISANRRLTYSTEYMDDLAHDVQLALLSLPNKVIDGAKVAASSTSTGSAVAEEMVYINITFTGDNVQGPQNLLTVVDYECYTGCTPKLTGVNVWSLHGGISSNVTEPELADFNSYECGRRGKCDYNTGSCQCFTGYTGHNCNTLSTLV